jgi:hypothetical protein
MHHLLLPNWLGGTFMVLHSRPNGVRRQSVLVFCANAVQAIKVAVMTTNVKGRNFIMHSSL